MPAVLSHCEGELHIGSLQRRAIRLPFLWRVQVTSIRGVKVRASAKIDFVSCLEQDGERQDVICRACGDDILATD